MPESYIQLPADSTGKKQRTWQEAVGANTVETPMTDQREEPTFSAMALDIAPAASKSMFSLFNANASTIVELQELYIVNTTSSAVTGVVIDFRLFKITGHSAGTAITINSLDSADTLASSIDAKTNGTVSGESASAFDRWRKWSDEAKLGIDYATMGMVVDTLLPAWSNTQRKTKSIVLRQNQGISVKCITSTTVGLFDVYCMFTTR